MCAKFDGHELLSQSDWKLWKKVKAAISKGNPANMQEVEQITHEEHKKL